MPGHLGDEQLWPMLDGAIIGGMGGTVNYLKDGPPEDWRKFLIALLTSGFAGMLAQLVVSWMNDDVRPQFAMAGIAGYLGVKLLDDVARRVRRLVNGSLDAIEKTVINKNEKGNSADL